MFGFKFFLPNSELKILCWQKYYGPGLHKVQYVLIQGQANGHQWDLWYMYPSFGNCARCIAVDLTVQSWCNARILGIPVQGRTQFLYIITRIWSPTHLIFIPPVGKVYCNRFGEAFATRIISIVHFDTKHNMADIGTNALMHQYEDMIQYLNKIFA